MKLRKYLTIVTISLPLLLSGCGGKPQTSLNINDSINVNESKTTINSSETLISSSEQGHDHSSSSSHSHSYTSRVTTEPGCETKGVRTYTCSCGDTYTENIEPLGHEYGSLIPRALPSYKIRGLEAHYRCSRCLQYFDVNKNKVTYDDLVLPAAGIDVALIINNQEITSFTLLEIDNEHASWKLENIGVVIGDTIGLIKPNELTTQYRFAKDSNIGNDNKSLVSGTYDLLLEGNSNGFTLSFQTPAPKGIVVSINDTKYPLNKVNYDYYDMESYMFGYYNFAEGDYLEVIDEVNDIEYKYDDLENDTLWNTEDFHKGVIDGSIIFDTAGKYAIEFDRNQNKKISITKVFEPACAAEYKIDFLENGRDGIKLSKQNYAVDSDEFKVATTFICNENTINAEGIQSYLSTNGYTIYVKTVSFTAGESFIIIAFDSEGQSINDVSSSHLSTVYGDRGCVALNGDYIQIKESGDYQIMYTPCTGTISINQSKMPSTVGDYVYNGQYHSMYADYNNIVILKTMHFNSGERLIFLNKDGDYLRASLKEGLEIVVERLSNGNIKFRRAGTYTISINITTNVLSMRYTLDTPFSSYEYTLDVSGTYSGQGTRHFAMTNDGTKAYISSQELFYNDIISVSAINPNDPNEEAVQFNTLDPTCSPSNANIFIDKYIQIRSTGNFTVTLDFNTSLIMVSR